MGFLSPWHWLIIGIVALLLFGKRMPEVARSMGRAINEFKRGLKDVGDDNDNTGSGPDPDRLKPGRSERDADANVDDTEKHRTRVRETQPE